MNRIRVGLAALLVAVLAAATLARVDRGGRDDGDHARGNRQHRTRAHQAPSAAGLTLAQFHRIARGAGFGIGDGDGVGDGGEVEAEDVRRGDDWFLGRRAYPRRRIPDGAWVSEQRQAGALGRRSTRDVGSSLQWTELGPRPLGSAAMSWIYGGTVPVSGRITSIATHPTDSRIAYVGAANGGVWKTVDGGTTWTPVFDSAPSGGSIAIGSIAIDPNNPNTVYVGTGEANTDTFAYFGTGLYRSTDAGGHWTKLGGAMFDQCSIGSIMVKPGASSLIVVGVMQGRIRYSTTCAADNRGGIYRSVDGGASFVRTSTELPARIIVAPNNPSVFYAGIWGKGVYKSVDSGGSWFAVLTRTGADRVEVTAVPAGGLSTTQTVYAAFATTGGAVLGIFRSNDGGASWLSLPLPIGYPTGSFCGGGNRQCNYDLAIAASPSDPNRMYVAGTYLDRYTANSPQLIALQSPGQAGCPFSGTTTGCIHVDYHALTYDAAGRLWLGNDGGAYRTSDGSTFTNVNGNLNNIQYNPGIAGSAASVVGGARDNGTSRLAGGIWSLVGDGDGGYAAVAGNGSVVFTSTQNLGQVINGVLYGSIHKLVNGSRCSVADNTGITELGPYVSPLVRDPGSQSIVYAGTSRIYRTANANTGCGQTTWTPVSQQFTTLSCSFSGQGCVSAIGPAPSDNAVYAATDTGQLYVTRDARTASTWTNTRANGLPGRVVSDIWVDPTNSAVAYLALSGFGSAGHVFKTTNYGGTWTSISGNLPNSPANAVLLDTRTTPAIIYVGMDAGVFWSSDGGTTWQNTSVGLPRTVVNDLLLDTAANRLIAATYGRGMWIAPPVGAAPAGPPNDLFSNARSAAVLPLSDSGVSTAQATTEGGEDTDPSCTDFIGKTVWYRFTPSVTTTLTADTTGSNFDTVLVAYQGTTLGGLTEVGCNDDPPGQTNAPSKITSIPVAAGQTYYVQVGGYQSSATATPSSGTLSVHLATP